MELVDFTVPFYTESLEIWTKKPEVWKLGNANEKQSFSVVVSLTLRLIGFAVLMVYFPSTNFKRSLDFVVVCYFRSFWIICFATIN